MSSRKPSIVSNLSNGADSSRSRQSSIISSSDGPVSQHLKRFTHMVDKSFGDKSDLSLSIDLSHFTESLTNISQVQSELHDTKKQYEVNWDSEADPQNPLNWPWSIKWTQTVLISATVFVR